MNKKKCNEIKKNINHIDKDISYHAPKNNEEIKIRIQKIKKLLEQERNRKL